MKSTGLGDDIHKFTTVTGIKSIVDRVSEGLNIPCGCAARQEWYIQEIKCMKVIKNYLGRPRHIMRN